jgi:hypothetical protein
MPFGGIDFCAFRGYVFVLSIWGLGALFGCVRIIRFRGWIGHSRGILLFGWCFLVEFLQISLTRAKRGVRIEGEEKWKWRVISEVKDGERGEVGS